MTNEEAIRILETDCHSPFPFTPGELDEACRLGASALRAQQTPVRLDRSRWEGCDICNNTPGIMFGVITMAIGKCFLSTDENELKYCPKCGRPLTEEAWAELERRIFGG